MDFLNAFSRVRNIRGMALVAVLWVVAALAVVAAGMLVLVKSHTRSVAAFQSQVVADALGDAAINLALRSVLEKTEQSQRFQHLSFEVDGSQIGVDVVPVSGLISLNGASEGLLTNLFAYAGSVSREKAEMLAQRVIDWRDPDGVAMPKGAEDDAYRAAGSPYLTRGGRFQAPEDLLQVLGVDFDLYVRIANLITTESQQALVDPAAAPEEVLAILAGGNVANARNLAEKRAGVGNGQFVVGGDSLSYAGGGLNQSIFRLDARVALPDSTIRFRRSVAQIGASDTSRYWKILRVWPSSVIGKAPADKQLKGNATHE